MLAALAACRKAGAAVLAGLAEAARAAAGAGRGGLPSGPSAPIRGAVVVPTDEGDGQIASGTSGTAGVLGARTTRPRRTADRRRLVSQELITAGAHEESEAVQAGAHVLTRWLGADAEAKPWADSSVLTMTAAGPGSLVLCTDGLWNYLPDADDIGRFCTGTDARQRPRAHRIRVGCRWPGQHHRRHHPDRRDVMSSAEQQGYFG